MAAVVPAMMVRRFEHLGLSPETVVLTAAAIYASIRFGLAALLRRFTVHRGIFHSCPPWPLRRLRPSCWPTTTRTLLRGFTAGGVVLGYLSHLLLRRNL